MNQRGALFALEDELLNVHYAVKKANYLMEELIEQFFCYNDDAIQDGQGLSRLQNEYGRATAKAEIARDLLVEVNTTLKNLLED